MSRARRDGLLHNPLDAAPAAIVTGGVLLALVPFFVALPPRAVAGLLVASLAARLIAPVLQHYHAHRGLFRRPTLNALFDQVLMLAAGNTTAVWTLQHVLGHHQLHLDQRADVAGVKRFGEGGRWRRAVFTVLGDALSVSDSLRIARRQNARKRGRLTRWLVAQLTVQVLATVALLQADPVLALALFVAPNVLLRWFVFWASFSQHDGAPAHDLYSGSMNYFGWTNAVFLNVGHHTAHHERPTLHWSLLPERTAQLLHRIPPACLSGLEAREARPSGALT
jgi:fatty acid desaturase